MQKLPTFYIKVTDFLYKSYRLSMGKLRNFYEKVTDLLKNNKFGTFGIDP